MTMGMAVGTVKTPPATRPTTIDVVEDEDWMRDVARIPMNKPTSGFVVVWIRFSAIPFPNIFTDVPINSRLKKKIYREINSLRRLNNPGCCL